MRQSISMKSTRTSCREKSTSTENMSYRVVMKMKREGTNLFVAIFRNRQDILIIFSQFIVLLHYFCLSFLHFLSFVLFFNLFIFISFLPFLNGPAFFSPACMPAKGAEDDTGSPAGS